MMYVKKSTALGSQLSNIAILFMFTTSHACMWIIKYVLNSNVSLYVRSHTEGCRPSRAARSTPFLLGWDDGHKNGSREAWRKIS